jgi:hypothetical protein
MSSEDRDPTTLDDFHAGRSCCFGIKVEPKDGRDGLAYWVATVETEDGEKMAGCEADSPSAAIAGATAAANDSLARIQLARIHIAGRVGSQELQGRLGTPSLSDLVAVAS